jgi:hypothetical protein
LKLFALFRLIAVSCSISTKSNIVQPRTRNCSCCVGNRRCTQVYTVPVHLSSSTVPKLQFRIVRSMQSEHITRSSCVPRCLKRSSCSHIKRLQSQRSPSPQGGRHGGPTATARVEAVFGRFAELADQVCRTLPALRRIRCSKDTRWAQELCVQTRGGRDSRVGR